MVPRKTDFEETSLFVLLHGVLPRDTSLLATPARPHHSMTSSTTATRRSKRLRDTNNSIVRKAIKVKKASSVKDMKLSVSPFNKSMQAKACDSIYRRFNRLSRYRCCTKLSTIAAENSQTRRLWLH